MNKKNPLINLGCRLNIYEGEIIKNHIKESNLKNITVINSCAVTSEAEKKVACEIRKAKRNKVFSSTQDCRKYSNNCKLCSID